MNYKRLSLFGILIIVAGLSTLFLMTDRISFHDEDSDYEEENEERPDEEVLTGKEKELFLKYLEERQQQTLLKSVSVNGESSYANGALTGTWKHKVPHTTGYGYRVDNSAYDSLRNVFYVVTYAGHLYKLEYENQIKWTLLNHKIQMNPPENASANPVFTGTLLDDSTFRLIRSNDNQNRMEYSDDEGKTWNISTGASVTRSWSNQAFEITNDNAKKIILHTYNSNYHHLYFSADNGKTYQESSLTFPISTYDVRIAKPFNTNDAYLWVWWKGSKKVDIYKYDPESEDFELKYNSSSMLAGTNLSSAAATFYGGKYHFYLSTINSDYTIYYSDDEGQTWTQKNAGRDKPFEIISPNKPNILISGFEDMKLSVNYGSTWTGYDHKLGWDLQHLKTFEMSGGKFITLAGLDFGCYVSETPENKDSYIWCNNEAWYAMHYDAATSERYNSVYMANQDRGTTAYPDTASDVNTVDIDGTDVLRVCFASKEKSVWTWFYYGRIKHRFNFPTGIGGEAVFDGLGNWWAAPIVASPDESEDAIYAAYGSNLKKFTYNSGSNSISQSTHDFNFNSSFGDDLGGFGYSKLNRNNWYAALNNGVFLYSKDAGITWTKTLYPGPYPKANDQSYNYPKNQIVIKASQIDSNRVYYAGVGNTFLISEDGGRIFLPHKKGLDIYRMRDFDLSPDEKYIFAACGYEGAWVFSVEDNYWYQMNDDPIPSVDFTDVQFIENKNCVRYSTFGSGIIDFYINTIFPPHPPIDFSASALTDFAILLRWTDNSFNEDGFIVERGTDGSFVAVDTVKAGTNIYVDRNLNSSTTYQYRLKAYNSGGSSEPTSTVEATTKTATGMDEIDMNIKLYPNPAGKVLNVELGAVKNDAILNIIDLKGKTHITEKISGGTERLTIPLDNLDQGTFILDITYDGKHLTREFIKQ
ncbi:T9SS type A sorting domain-containing protein [Saccharicrinis sp. FJH2]|uniref:T9SS type A sorting domain-containing protein n=1 Tax=Saccharicrinis sp. FJH65 TaxID=3344659 RepID=UPI0035F38D5B